MASATPKITLKTTTCSTSPSATAFAMFSGKTWSDDVLPRLGRRRCGLFARRGGGSVMPTPARLMLIAAHPMSSASVVTISK